MITSAAQWTYVWLAYGLAALVIGCLFGWVILDARRRSRQLAALEARGVRRRSDHAI
jgi:heme exporter protein D